MLHPQFIRAATSAAMWLRKSHKVTLTNGFFSAHDDAARIRYSTLGMR